MISMEGETMTKQFKHIQSILEIESKRLNEELELEVIPSTGDGYQGNALGKKDETAWESSESEKHRAVAQNIREQLAAVDCVLKKLDNGTYGLCDSCGKAIPLARLEAIPHTNHCVDCKVHQVQ